MSRTNPWLALSVRRNSAVLILAAATALCAGGVRAEQATIDRAPELPSPLCDALNVAAGNSVVFHAYAGGGVTRSIAPKRPARR